MNPNPIKPLSGTVLCLMVAAMLLAPSKADALSLDLAVSVSQPSLQLKSAQSGVILGEMVDRASVWPSVALATRERYFGDSNFGYKAEMMAWYMKMKHQKTGGKQLDLGTSASGYFAYLTPTLYYRFGDKYSMESPDWLATVGIGLGVGYLNVRGTMITTETTPSQLRRLDQVGFGLSTGIFLEVMKNKWFLRLTNFGPVLNGGSTKLELRDNSVKLGRRFEFDIF